MSSLAFAGLLVTAAADSIVSCGSATDHLQVTSINVDADADKGPRKGKPFTVTLEGVFDEDHVSGVVVGDLNLKALGIVDQPIAFNQKYDYSPGLPTGTNKLTVGPFTFPRAIPGVLDFTGQLNVLNDRAEPVACLTFDFHIPKILMGEEELATGKALTCGDPSTDHITNIETVTDSTSGVDTTTMDLDTDQGYVNLNVDIAVKVPFLPAVSVRLPEVPITLDPPIPAGQLTFVGYPAASLSASASSVAVTGTLQLEDVNGAETTCIVFDAADSAISV